jgi:nucleotide-binding universal stress UspA family protein
MSSHPIVCCTDFSPGSDRALEVAASLARGLSAPLALVHAMDTPRSAGYVFWRELGVGL